MITIYPNLYSPAVWQRGPEDWESLVQLFEREGYETFEEKDQCPLFGTYLLDPGQRRHNSCVKEVTALVLDLDKATEEQTVDLFERLDREGFAFLAYETFRSRMPVLDKKTGITTTAERWRIILPLDAPVSAKAWYGFFKAATAKLAPFADQQDNDTSRSYYLPARPPGAPEVNPILVGVGAPIKTKDFLGEAFDYSVAPRRAPISKTALDKGVLEALARRWKRSTSAVTLDLGFRLERAMRGESFAATGERDGIAFALSCALISEAPHLDPVAVAELFEPALHRMSIEDPDGALTVEMLISKLERAADRATGLIVEEEEAAARKRFVRAGRGKYTKEELAALAESLGVSDEQLQHCWVLQKHGQYYVLQPDGTYFAETKESLLSGARRALAPSPVELQVQTKHGPRELSERELLQEHATALRTVSKSMVLQAPRVDLENAALVLPACPLLPIAPKYDEEIEAWLKLLGGDQYENLLDWIALVTRLDCPLPVLVLIGQKGGGKTLISHGLARLWTNEGPMKLQKVFSDFNAGLERCPIVLADEGIEDARGVPQTARLREFVSDQKHHINPKFGAQFDLVGCARVIIAANNHTVLDTPGHLTLSDIAAIAERFFTLKVGADAENYLKSIGGRPKIEGKWLEGGALAAHFAHIQTTRNTTIKSRFGIVHDSSEVYSRLLVRSGLRGKICELLVRLLVKPTNVRPLCIRPWVGISTSQLLEVWGEVWPGERPPPTTVLGTALHELASEKEEENGQVIALIESKYLLAWLMESGYCSVSKLESALEKDYV